MSTKWLRVILIGVGLLSLGGILAVAALSSPQDYIRELPDFTLTSHTGEERHLSDFEGDVVLLSFGYTNCPDICPLTLGDMNQVARTLSEEDLARTDFLFISVDPARDTPQRLADYVPRFNPKFIGLTGSEEYLRQMGQDYGLVFEYEQPPGTAASYLVAHTAGIFMIDQEGRLVKTFPYRTAVEDIAADVHSRLAAG